MANPRILQHVMLEVAAVTFCYAAVKFLIVFAMSDISGSLWVFIAPRDIKCYPKNSIDCILLYNYNYIQKA